MGLRNACGPIVVFLDFDGTLVIRCVDGPGERPTEPVIEALDAFAATGGMPILSSGRSLCSAATILPLIPLRGSVTMDGAAVELEGETLYDATIPIQDLEPVIDEMLRVGMTGFFQGSEQCFAVGPRGEAIFEPWPLVHSFEEALALGPGLTYGKIDFTDTSLAAFRRSEYLQREFTHYLVDFGSHELVSPGVDKGRSAQMLIDALIARGQAPSRVYAIGDSENDVPLFRVADVSVAMGQSLAHVRAQADYVTATDLDDGVARALEYFGLIPHLA